YKQFNGAKPTKQESFNSGEAKLAPISNIVQLYVAMRCEAAFLEKTIFTEEISHRVRTIRPAAEFRDHDLRTACEEMSLSEQLRIPTNCDPMQAYSVIDLVHTLNDNLNH
ncbi:unnamed protein product, partial [Hymenolepis diminuta]